MTSPPTGIGRRALAAYVGLAVASSAVSMMLMMFVSAGCDRTPDTRLPDQLTVALDEPGTSLLYGGDDRQLVPVTSLRDIPEHRRGAVAIYHPDQVPVRPDGDAVYVADLSDAERGEEVSSRRMSRDAFEARIALLHRAVELGRHVGLTGRERAKMTEGSTRRERSEEARRKFRELLDRIPKPPDADSRQSPSP